MKWECRESSFEEQVFKAINLMYGPVAIVLFGVDSELKNSVEAACWQKIHDLADGSSPEKLMDLERAYRAIQVERKVIVVMPGVTSVWENYRREVVLALRRLGAVKVIGVFAKRELDIESSGLDARVVEMNHLIKALAMQPPKAEEFDQLIIVEST